MQAKNAVLHNGCEWEVIEQVREHLPNISGPVLPQTFVVKSVHLRDLPALMVSAQNVNSVLEPDFQRYKQCYGLDLQTVEPRQTLAGPAVEARRIRTL
jgi:hypothetical protein